MTAPSPPPPHPARIPSAPPASAVWGRGALDIKFNVAALLETLSLLIQDGFVPQRTIYVTFGHDEEVGVLSSAGMGAEGGWECHARGHVGGSKGDDTTDLEEGAR